MNASPFCPCCLIHEETNLHSILGCYVARKFWFNSSFAILHEGLMCRDIVSASYGFRSHYLLIFLICGDISNLLSPSHFTYDWVIAFLDDFLVSCLSLRVNVTVLLSMVGWLQLLVA